MTQNELKQIADIMNRNIGNRLSEDLANGMFMAISRIQDDPPVTDTSDNPPTHEEVDNEHYQ